MKNYKEILNEITTFLFDVDGVLTDGTMILLPDGSMSRTMHTRDGFAMKYAIDKGYKIGIITGGRDKMVAERCKGLGITDIYLGSHYKLEDYKDMLYKYNLKPSEIMFMGDDVPDLAVMKEVGLAACPKDACPEIRAISHYISPLSGGKGCVRDIIEQTLKAQGNWNVDDVNLPASI